MGYHVFLVHGYKFTTIPNLKNKSQNYYIDFLLGLSEQWTIELSIPKLSRVGVGTSDFNKIVKATDSKNNPVPLNQDEMIEVLELAT